MAPKYFCTLELCFLSLSLSQARGGLESTPASLVSWEGKYTSKRVGSTLQGVERGEIAPLLTPSLLAEVSAAWHLQSLVGKPGAWDSVILGMLLALVVVPYRVTSPPSSLHCVMGSPARSHSVHWCLQCMRLPPSELRLRCRNLPEERFNPRHQNKTLHVCFFTLHNCQD